MSFMYDLIRHDGVLKIITKRQYDKIIDTNKSMLNQGIEYEVDFLKRKGFHVPWDKVILYKKFIGYTLVDDNIIAIFDDDYIIRVNY